MAQTEIDCQGVSARMMELLYGELSGDERATVEAHLTGCPSCRAELAGFQSTRASARRTLDADQPPARAHQAILRAAAAAVAAKQAKPIEARGAIPEPSFWARWRTRWTLPTFATLGAVAVVVLASKVFLEPDKTVELGRQALQSAPAEAPATPPPAKPPATAEPAVANEDELAKQAPPAAPAKKRKGEAREQLQPSVAHDAPARSIAAPAAQRQRAAPGGLATREFAPPPPPLAEPARPSPPAANQRTGRDSEEEALEEAAPALRGGVGQVAGGSGAAPPAARATAKKADKKAEMPSEMDDLDRGAAAKSAPAPRRAPAAPAAASLADKADAESAGRAESTPAAESPVARADRLFAQGQWAAAARAYRELLRRDPGNGDAARWRQRLAASEEAASAQAPAAASPASRGR